MGERVLQSLDGRRTGGRRGRRQGGQGRLGGIKTLDKRALSGVDIGHGTAEFRTLAMEVAGRPLEVRFAAGQGGGRAAREVRS